ncbi:hypothetical protein M758_10G164500 [Ceratodon purpureus]|uniref:beta-glucosidase n=1 Tax=Ceratodon purpureus TaxID=3225 RepID=A0A8T0GPT7_CERPU|nr:hypothetical protein KC19_10G169000 [Ceratodon purpureus]KAG0604342.1 hypothetical protein M758_10G164500 [Ceratodon purpureus]
MRSYVVEAIVVLSFLRFHSGDYSAMCSCFRSVSIYVVPSSFNVVQLSTQVIFDPAPKPGSTTGMDYAYAIVAMGKPPYEFLSDNLALSASQQQMITDVCADVACVVVMILGRPLVSEPWLALVLVARLRSLTGIADVWF